MAKTRIDNEMVEEKDVFQVKVFLNTKKGMRWHCLILSASGQEEISQKIDEWMFLTRKKNNCTVERYEVVRKLGEPATKKREVA